MRFVFLGESLLLITYYYSWNRLAEPASKWAHASIGLLSNLFGTALLLLANAWSAFMMAPAGVDAKGQFLGNGWHLLHSALWNPLNVHRFLANIMSGGAVVMAYACYRFFTSKTEKESAYFDWVGHIFLFVTVMRIVTDALCRLLVDAIGLRIQPEYGCDDDGWITHLALRRAGHLDRRPLPRRQLLPLAEYGAPSRRGAVSALLPSAALGVHGGVVYLADAAHRVYVGQ